MSVRSDIGLGSMWSEYYKLVWMILFLCKIKEWTAAYGGSDDDNGAAVVNFTMAFI